MLWFDDRIRASREGEDVSLGARSQHTAKLAKWWRVRGPRTRVLNFHLIICGLKQVDMARPRQYSGYKVSTHSRNKE